MGRLISEAWERINTPEHILQWIKYGVKIPFREEPAECFLPNRIKGAKECNFVDAEIAKLIQEGSIRKCFNWKPKCVLPLQCVPKKQNDLRLILDCRHINTYVQVPKFNQESIEVVANQIQEGDVMISVDLEQGFHHVDLHISVQSFFGMSWRGEFYVWRVLPFGCSASPYVFKKVLEPVSAYLRDQNLRLALFVDDFLRNEISISI